MPIKPSEAEEEYFARQEYEKRKKTAQQTAKRLAEEEKKKLKQLHYMRCPKCGMELIEISFKQIRIDRCSSCSGVWLDAGELESVAEEESGGFISRLSGLFPSGKSDS
jgi:uncharacterized protein with PIN domain